MDDFEKEGRFLLVHTVYGSIILKLALYKKDHNAARLGSPVVGCAE